MADIKQQLEQLTERIAAERLRIRNQAEKLPPKLQRGETSNAQAILTAQLRAAFEPHLRSDKGNLMAGDAAPREWLGRPKKERPPLGGLSKPRLFNFSYAAATACLPLRLRRYVR
jgi:hypothetical protein